MRFEELTLEGRNAVLEAFRAGKTIDRLMVQDGCGDGPIKSILREAKKQDTVVQFIKKERLDQMSLSHMLRHMNMLRWMISSKLHGISRRSRSFSYWTGSRIRTISER